MRIKNKLLIFVVAVIVCLLIATYALFSNTTPPPHWPAWLYIALGIMFLVLAIREFRGRIRS